MTHHSVRDPISVDDGSVYLTGNQALVRLPFELSRRDKKRGRRTGVFISGYPGSPLGGYDLALARRSKDLDKEGIVHVPAGNEEQAVTACMGTQMLDAYPRGDVDGVFALWYGKGPGLDRSGDALKHGNFAGTSEHGGVVVLMGDDHEAKSSTMPFQSDLTARAAGMPILAPADVHDVLRLGIHAAEMSRYSGCWTGFKLTNSVCDGGSTIDLTEARGRDVAVPALHFDGVPFAKKCDFSFFPGKNVEQERHLHEERLVAARAYVRGNRLDEITVQGDQDRIGLVASGAAWTAMRQALVDLGLDDDRLRAAGVRLMKSVLVWPVDPVIVRAFADGLDTIIVVEEKLGLLQEQIQAVLQEIGSSVRVLGKRDARGDRMFPLHGGFGADVVATALAKALSDHVPGLSSHPRLKAIADAKQRVDPTMQRRTPNFCSGCPHSTSTLKAAGQTAWGAPGCGGFCTVIEQPERHIDTMTQYGGEGLPWVGLSKFTTQEHLIQHVGDGSFYHSSHLNIRWAVATGTTITFKILYNSAVANTGAQSAPGHRGVAALTRLLEAEGVEKIVIVTKKRRQYRRQSLGRGTDLRRASEIVDVSAELGQRAGVSVMIYDETCANERRRQRKRGLLPPPERYVYVNQRVCEDCGDCGRASNCMSLQKVDTEFGSKTRIHQSSCNQDLSCLKGDCPSFVTIAADSASKRARRPADLTPDDLVAPTPVVPAGPFSVVAPGVGGTGVLTMNAMLAVAAERDGFHVRTYDQTGAAQKWGAVVSTLTLHRGAGDSISNLVGPGQADLMLALDEVTATAADIQTLCAPERTALVLNSDLFPTSEMVRDVHAGVDTDATRGLLRAITRDDAQVSVPARTIAEDLFGDYMMTNIVAIGAAVQAGTLPLNPESIETAIAYNGVAVDANVQAFRFGRLWVQDTDRVRALIDPPPTPADEERDSRARRLSRRDRDRYLMLMGRVEGCSGDLRRLLAVRVAELIEYQSVKYADRYLTRVEAAASMVDGHPASDRLLQGYVSNLFKVYAYKDEYEVARLHLLDECGEDLRTSFSNVRQMRFHLSPPMWRALGRKGKVAIPGWLAVPMFTVLRNGAFLRGTPLDLFGRQKSRRLEREIRDWYEQVSDRALGRLSALNDSVVQQILELPESIRGYEELKTRSAEEATKRATQLEEQLDRPPLPLFAV